MSKIAVIRTGGKQYKVKVGDIIKIEKLTAKDGEKVDFDTLMIAETDGSLLKLGSPLLKEKVQAEVVDTKKEDKVRVLKYKNKTRYKRNIGHRQLKTAVKILEIV
jgi:large subunit ribosomal protein L21